MSNKSASLQSIHDSGEPALDTLIALLNEHGSTKRGPRSGPNAKTIPDVTFTPTGSSNSIPLEVKKTGKSIPQMRALSFKVVVVWKAPTLQEPARWWVVGPDEILLLATDHSGHHCTSSFECMNPGPPSGNWTKWECSSADLVQRIKDAHAAGAASPLKELASQMRKEIDSLYAAHKERVLAKKLEMEGKGA